MAGLSMKDGAHKHDIRSQLEVPVRCCDSRSAFAHYLYVSSVIRLLRLSPVGAGVRI